MALPPLPAGFALDQAPAPAADVPPLPTGFKIDNTPAADPYETARQNLSGYEKQVAGGHDVSEEDFLKPASEGGTREFWDQKGRRYGTKLAGLTDVGGILQSAKEAGKAVLGQGQSAVEEINKKVYGDETTPGEGLKGLAKGVGSFAAGLGTGAVVKGGQFVSNLAGDVLEPLFPGDVEGANELRRMKERAIAEGISNKAQEATGNPAMFGLGSTVGEQAAATQIPTVEAFAPRAMPKIAMAAGDLAQDVAGVGAKTAGYGVKGAEKVLGTPAGRASLGAAAYAAGIVPWYIPTAEFIAEMGNKGALNSPMFGGTGVIKKIYRGISQSLNDLSAKPAVFGEVMTEKPLGMTYSEFVRQVGPDRIDALGNQIEDLRPFAGSGSTDSFLQREALKSKKAVWERVYDRAENGTEAPGITGSIAGGAGRFNDWFWDNAKDAIASGTHLMSTVGQAGVMGEAVANPSDEQGVTKAAGSALALALPFGLMGMGQFSKRVAAERFAKAGAEIRGSNPELDAISQTTEASRAPSEQMELNKFKGKIAAAGGETPDGSRIEAYVLPPDQYADVVTAARKSGGNELPDEGPVKDQSDNSRGYFDASTGRFYINAGSGDVMGAIRHEGSTALSTALGARDSNFQDVLRSQLVSDMQKNPEVWNQFQQNYEKALGQKIDSEQLLDEWTAEMGRHIEEGKPLKGLDMPKSMEQLAGGSIYKALQWAGVVSPKTVPGSEFGTPVVNAAIKTYSKALNAIDPSKALRAQAMDQEPVQRQAPAEDVISHAQAWNQVKTELSSANRSDFEAIKNAIGEVRNAFKSGEVGTPDEMAEMLNRQFSMPSLQGAGQKFWESLSPVAKRQLMNEIAENHSTILNRLDDWRKYSVPEQASPKLQNIVSRQTFTSPRVLTTQEAVAPSGPPAELPTPTGFEYSNLDSLVQKLVGGIKPGEKKTPSLRTADTIDIRNAALELGQGAEGKDIPTIQAEADAKLGQNALWKSLQPSDKYAFAETIQKYPDSAFNVIFGFEPRPPKPQFEHRIDPQVFEKYDRPTPPAAPVEEAPKISTAPEVAQPESAPEVPAAADEHPIASEPVAPEPIANNQAPGANLRVQEGEGVLGNVQPFTKPLGMTQVTSERRFNKATGQVDRVPVKTPYLQGQSFNRENPDEMAVLNKAAAASGDSEGYLGKISDIENHIANGQYLDIDYNSAESQSKGVPLALERRAARASVEKGEAERKIVQKNIIPQTIKQSGDNLLVQGYSVDKVIGNGRNLSESINRLVSENPTLSPELNRALEYFQGTDWERDLKARNENMENGFRGDGQLFMEPRMDNSGAIIGATDAGARTRNPDYTPVRIDDWKIQALNLLEGGTQKTYLPESMVNVPGTGRDVNLPEDSANPLQGELEQAGDQLYIDRNGKKVSGLKNIIEPAAETLRIDRIDKIRSATKKLEVNPSSYKQRASGFLPPGATDLGVSKPQLVTPRSGLIMPLRIPQLISKDKKREKVSA